MLFRSPDGTVSLRPAHPGMGELEIPASEVRVVGVLIALLRRYPR